MNHAAKTVEEALAHLVEQAKKNNQPSVEYLAQVVQELHEDEKERAAPQTEESVLDDVKRCMGFLGELRNLGALKYAEAPVELLASMGRVEEWLKFERTLHSYLSDLKERIHPFKVIDRRQDKDHDLSR